MEAAVVGRDVYTHHRMCAYSEIFNCEQYHSVERLVVVTPDLHLQIDPSTGIRGFLNLQDINGYISEIL